MTLTWLPGAKIHDLHPGIGNGPFKRFLGVVLHVNVDEGGTPDSFWGNGNPGQVCPNFQVYKDGSIHQMLPLDWQPWCQIDGNFNYAAIETAGMPNEPLTDAQLHACAKIVRAYHDQMGMALKVANEPGQPGLGIHSMGGAAWGGHPCPGVIRAAQRREILALAMPSTTGTSTTATPAPTDPNWSDHVTKDELTKLIHAEVIQGLRAALLGGPYGDFSPAANPGIIHDATHGVLDRLAALEAKVKP